MDNLENINVDFLEGLSDDEAVTKLDASVEDADIGVAGMENLENLQPINSVSNFKENSLSRVDDKKVEEAKNPFVDTFLDETDVRLRDVVEKIFRRSDRPCVIIRDDVISYANKTFLELLECLDIHYVLQKKFLKFVAKEDWNFLAKNIGEMLTRNEAMEIRFVCANHKIVKAKFEAIYLFDNQHFTFILIGNRLGGKSVGALSMYDQLTGLPNFYLFEDRVQVIVNYENYKDVRQKKNFIAVVGIALDNFNELKAIGMNDLILHKLAEKLMLTLRKTYSVGRGLKYHFWILLPDIFDEETLKLELDKIQALFQEPIADNFTVHHISASIGVSVFPEPATSAKKLIEQAILSIQKAQKEGGNRMQIFGL